MSLAVDAVAADLLDVDIGGSGDVSYCGDPRVTRSIDGSGSISQASPAQCGRGSTPDAI